MIIPESIRDRTRFAQERLEECYVSLGQRQSTYRNYGQWLERGWASDDGQGGLALANVLFSHDDRVAAHLFSPSELRFGMAFERHYKKITLDQGAVAARNVTEEWHASDKSIDLLFGHGVKVAVDYGACLIKQLAGKDEEGNYSYRGCRLVMPWMFGVANEGVNGLENQEFFCETMMANKWEVWRNIAHLPEAKKLFERIIASADKTPGPGRPTSFMHQVLSTAVLNLSPAAGRPTGPGGWIQTTGGPAYPPMLPQSKIDLFPRHEIWVWNDQLSDYTTFVYFEPDILVSPLYRPTNLFVPGHCGYTLIQPNFVPEYFFGYSEIRDLMRLQSWLTEHLGDIRKIMGQQFDKLLAFAGDMMIDEKYAEYKANGAIPMGMGGQVTDVTPKLPEQALALIGEILYLMDRISGFPGVMSGEGQPGVRAGVHADTLMKTGSTRLRDRSLLVERQCAQAGDETLALAQAKDDSVWWVKEEDEETHFTLAQLPEDRRIVVDSHSSSPIYQDDHVQLVAWGVKAGILDPITALEMLPFQNKDLIIERVKRQMEQKQAQLKELEQRDPEAFARVIAGGHGARHRRSDGDTLHQ